MRLQSNEQYLNYCLVGGNYILVIFTYIAKSTNRETAEIKRFHMLTTEMRFANIYNA